MFEFNERTTVIVWPVKLVDVQRDGYCGKQAHVDWYEALVKLSPDAAPKRVFLANHYTPKYQYRPDLDERFVRRRVFLGIEVRPNLPERPVMGIQTIAFNLLDGRRVRMTAFAPGSPQQKLVDWCRAHEQTYRQTRSYRQLRSTPQ